MTGQCHSLGAATELEHQFSSSMSVLAPTKRVICPFTDTTAALRRQRYEPFDPDAELVQKPVPLFGANHFQHGFGVVRDDQAREFAPFAQATGGSLLRRAAPAESVGGDPPLRTPKRRLFGEHLDFTVGERIRLIRRVSSSRFAAGAYAWTAAGRRQRAGTNTAIRSTHLPNRSELEKADNYPGSRRIKETKGNGELKATRRPTR